LFTVEDRIRFSLARTVEVLYPNTIGGLLVDNRRDLVYAFNGAMNQLVIYSQLTQEFRNPVPLPHDIYNFCLAGDINSILIVSREEQSMSIIDIDSPTPHIDTTISLPGEPIDIGSLSDGTVLIPVRSENSVLTLLHLDLTTFALDTLDLGIDPWTVTTSGNSEFALILGLSNPGSQKFMVIYQTGVGPIASRVMDWPIILTSGNYDGSLFYGAGWDSPEQIAIVFDNNLNLVDSIPSIPCNYYRERGIFSQDGRDIFTIDMNTVGIVNTQSFDFEGFYWTNQDYSQPTFFDIAVNGNNDRLFLVSFNLTGTGYTFWDIPLEPRRN
jgi:hypothetical protein